MKSVYTVLIKLEDGGYTVRVPDVPGCVTGGETIDEAIYYARDALNACLCVYEDDNLPLPPVHLPDAVPKESDEFAALIDVDTDRYRAETDNRAVRKNVSLPQWMVTRADAMGLNCSQVLQEALRAKFAV